MAKLKETISNNLVLSVIAFAVIAFTSVGLVTAYSGNASTVFEGDCVNCTINEASTGFGARQSDLASGLYDVYIENSLQVDGSITTVTGSITATTTLTALSNNIQLFEASTVSATTTLPAVKDGLRFSFLVTGALTGDTVVIVSAEGNNIEGVLSVAYAAVDCANEDKLNILTDGEVIGDYVELISDGTSWFILDSDVKASGKMTCTT